MATKVLMFGWEFPPHNSGGLGVACLGITRALAREGFDITFVLPKKLGVSSGDVRIKFADVDKIKFRPIDSLLHPYVTSSRYQKLLYQNNIYGPDLLSEVMRYAALAAEIATEEDYDIIYAHDWLSFGAGLEAKRATGKRLIVHVHATEFDRSGSASVNSQVYALEKAGMEEADHIIAVSQFTKNIIVEKYGIPAEKVTVVHNGIDDCTFPHRVTHSSRLSIIKKAGHPIVLFVGRITLQKGPDYFIRAAKRALEIDPNIFFIIAGSGDMEQQILREAAYYKITDRVLFAGFLTGIDLAEAYALADLYIMPSVSEPFGITPLEAMKSGTPVIISRQSGVSEILHHALKVDFWDTDEMANKIISIVSHPALRHTLSHNGQREVGSLTWEVAAKKIKRVIHKTLEWLDTPPQHAHP